MATKPNKAVLNGSNQDISLGFNASVVGSSGRESIQVASGVDVSITGGAGDRILLTGDAADYTFTQQGSNLLLTSGGHTITLAIGGELRLIFADIEVIAAPGFTAEGFQLAVGEQVVGASFDVSQLVAAEPSSSSEDPNDPPAAKANKVILNGDDQDITLGFDASVVGTSGRENLTCEPGVVANFTGGAGDRLILTGNAADYDYQQQGSTLLLTLGGKQISLGLGGDLRIAFADKEVSAKPEFGATGLQIKLGGQLVGNGFKPGDMLPFDQETDTTTDTSTDTANTSTDDALSGSDGQADIFVYHIDSNPSTNQQGTLWAGNSGRDTIDNFEVGVDKLKIIDDSGQINTLAEFTAGFTGLGDAGINYAAAMSGGQLLIQFGPSEANPNLANNISGIGELRISGVSGTVTDGASLVAALGGESAILFG
ncbi:hypothetical protein SAMN05421831_102201 [Allopseudospirillum japonicum]|uniref:T5SS/PEP-CTERM-associated repeat-containing protein n=1 Tax=Allopseudospirillum japonicum TaxID=64971 RepID=A0A1H6R1C1_9GAMM|nr:hypothetical protein [Allopseudospirillum japonicum]SEI47054.1 hypothetical protein SAMN05421831_102201 [Allopseudospirillum japonicum]